MAGVSVRLVSVDDAAACAALYVRNREFLAPWDPTRPPEFDTEETQRRLIVDALERRDLGQQLPLVIIVDGVIVGRINVSDIVRGAFLSAHLGYWVDREQNGRGVATAAVAAVLALAFGELGLHRLQAATLVHNHGSQAVLQRNHFTPIGLAPRYLRIAGRWQDHLLFQRIADRDGQPSEA